MRNIADDLVITCYEILDTPVTTSIVPNDKRKYWCLLMMVVTVVKCYMKRRSTISCLLAY